LFDRRTRVSAHAIGLVEGSGKFRAAEVFEEVGDLGGGDANEREWGEMVFGKELCISGFVGVFRGSTNDLGKEEKLVGVEGVGRMAVKIAIKDGGELGDANLIAGFFAGFASGGDRWRLADIGPTAGEGPAAVFEFSDKKDAAVLEGGHSSINFWSGVTGLLGKEFFERFGVGKRGAGSHHFHCDAADFVIAVNIELVLAIGEAGLRDGLKAARPCEPLRNRHESILAAGIGREQVLNEDIPMTNSDG